MARSRDEVRREREARERQQREEQAPKVNGHAPLLQHGFIDGICKPYFLPAELSIPARQWLYAPWCVRETVSMLHGLGGVGKTSLYLTEAIAMATGRDLLGVMPSRRSRVWIMNLEEAKDELDRRIAAICRRYGITSKDLEGWLFVDGRPTKPFHIARRAPGNGGVQPIEQHVDLIVSSIKDSDIDCLIVDPYSSSHSLTESNEDAAPVYSLWADVAQNTKAHVGIVCHDRKGAFNPDSPADSSRGGRAAVDAVRIARALRVMTKEEGTKHGLTPPEHRQYVAIYDSKTNISTLGGSTWFRLVTMHLDNGDAVQAVEAWKPPSASDGIDDADLDAFVADLARKGAQRADPRSVNWAGWQLADHLALPGAKERSDAARSRASQLLQQLAKVGKIRSTVVEIGRKDRPMVEAVLGAVGHDAGFEQ